MKTTRRPSRRSPRLELREGRVGALVVLLFLLTGCPPTDQKASPDSSSSTSTPRACSKVGQSCEVTAGKLGTCVQKDDCSDPAGCFVCQPQH